MRREEGKQNEDAELIICCVMLINGESPRASVPILVGEEDKRLVLGKKIWRERLGSLLDFLLRNRLRNLARMILSSLDFA